MEAQYKTRDGRLIFKVDAENQKEIFKQIAVTQEVFEAETECGCCHSKEIRFRVRTVDKHDFYEVACGGCGARFEFGQHKNGRSLFPKRRAEDGTALPNRGWAKWEVSAASVHDKVTYKSTQTGRAAKDSDARQIGETEAAQAAVRNPQRRVR